MRIINNTFQATLYIKKVKPYMNYNYKVVAKLLDSDKKEICELYKEDNLIELAEKLSKAKNADEIVDIMGFENMLFGDSPDSIENTYLTEYEEGLYMEEGEELDNIMQQEKEWFETTLKPQINRIGQTYILINF